LTVLKDGFGTGTVSASAPDRGEIFNCGMDCSGTVESESTVTLTANVAQGGWFYGWSGGGCAGTGTCVTTISEATTVTATFDECDRSAAEECDNTTNIYKQCSADGRLGATMTCAMYCSATVEKCVDIDPSDDRATSPLNAQMDMLASADQNLVFPNTCTAATCTIDTFDGQIVGANTGGGAPSVVIPGVGRVFRVATMSISGVVKVRGNFALVVLAKGAVTIVGRLDASADMRFKGPGAETESETCEGRFYRSANTITPGAGGGGRSGRGAAGGNSNTVIVGTAGGAMVGDATLIPLLGGCNGGWVDESGGSSVTLLGAGGGAVQLVSRVGISIFGNGVIDVSGGGAPSGDYFSTTLILGGAGGGSGGSILLEAPAITLDGSGVALSAKGGGGAAAGARGFDGADGGYGPGVANGGINPNGADGGAGGNETTGPLMGQSAQGAVADGGGGGGSAGLCRLNSRDGAIILRNGPAIRCQRQTNTAFTERLLP